MPDAQDRQRRRVARYYRWLDRLAFLRELRGQSGSEAEQAAMKSETFGHGGLPLITGGGLYG